MRGGRGEWAREAPDDGRPINAFAWYPLGRREKLFNIQREKIILSSVEKEAREWLMVGKGYLSLSLSDRERKRERKRERERERERKREKKREREREREKDREKLG